MRMAPAEEAADPDGRSLGRVHQGDGARVPAGRRSSSSETVTKPIWEALVAGARYSHETVMEIWDDVRPDVDRHGQRHGLSGGRDRRVPMGAVRVGQPARDARRVACRRRSRDCRSATRARSGETFREEYRRRHEELLDPAQRVSASVGVAPCPLDEFNTHSPCAEPVPVPRGGGLPAVRHRSRHVAPAAVDRAHVRSAVRRRRRTSRVTASSSTCRWGRSGAWTSA